MVDFQDNAILNEEVFSKLIPQAKIEEITAHTNDTLVMLLNSLGIKATRQEDGNFLLTVKEHNQNKQSRKAIFEEIKGLQGQQDQTDPDRLEKIGVMISSGIDNLLNALDSLNPLSPTEAFAGDLDFMEEDLKKDQEELEKLEEEKKSLEELVKLKSTIIQIIDKTNILINNVNNSISKGKLTNDKIEELIKTKEFLNKNSNSVRDYLKETGEDWKGWENNSKQVLQSIDKILSTYNK